MKRAALSFACILAASLAGAFAEEAAIGRIDYVEGGATITRSSKILGEANIDDVLLSGDLIKTASDGLVVIAMDKSTGMNGSITVRAKTALYIKVENVKGEKKTTVDLIAGSIGSKVTKLAGAPKMQVTTSNTVMGVRGTQFLVSCSVNDAILVACDEGQVFVTDGKEEIAVPAGKAVQKRLDERFISMPIALSSAEEFRKNWIADEIEAFNANPVAALAGFEKRYSDYGVRFDKAFEPLARSVVLKKWLDEDRAGVVPRALDPNVMKEKKEIIGPLQSIRKVLFIYERLYYRVEEIVDLLAGGQYDRKEIKKGLTVGDFIRRYRDEKDGLGRRMALFRYAEKLYELRNEGGPSGSDEFFGSDSDFFGESDF